MQFVERTVTIFGFQYRLCLCGRGERFAGRVADWERCSQWMQKALKACAFGGDITPGAPTFAGPRIEIRLVDALGREWTGPAVGFDFRVPECLGLRYQGADDEMHTPLMLVRSTFGSIERFVAILVEHYAGRFPLWLAPEQVRILPVAERHLNYAQTVCQRLVQEGIRATVDVRRENLGFRIHAFEEAKVPFVVVIGDREESRRVLAVRQSLQEKQVNDVRLEEFLEQLRGESQAPISEAR